MSRARRALAALARDERGFTLVELLAATAIGLVVLGVAVTLFTVGIGSQRGISARAYQVQQGRATVERIVRELRQASTAPTATSSQLAMVTYVHSATCGGATATTAIACQVTYACSAGICTRTERNPDGTGTGAAEQVVTGLASSSVFTYSPSTGAPTYVGITLSFAPKAGQDAVSIDDGAAFANRSTAS